MYRIDDKTALPFMPVPEETGTEGYFTEGNRAAGTPATIVRASWLNMVQEELRNIVVAGGLNPSKDSNGQVLDALLARFARRITAAGGTSEQITATFTPHLTKLTDGVSVLVRAAMANQSTTSTFQADETARKAIVKGNNLPLASGDVSGEGHWLELHYDAKLDKWVLQNPARGVLSALPPGGTTGQALRKTSNADGDVVWEHVSGVPVGTIEYFAMQTPPAGYLAANGGLVSRATYPDLFAAIGTTFGAGDGETTFNLPDLRGEFLRGLDGGRGVDAGRVFGSAQGDALQNLTGSMTLYEMINGVPSSGVFASTHQAVPNTYRNRGDGYHSTVTFNAANIARTAAETRPRNIALLACIKAFDAATNSGLIDITALANEMAGKAPIVNTFGFDQRWQDVKSQRMYNTIYTNGTGRPIVVSAGGENLVNAVAGVAGYVNDFSFITDGGSYGGQSMTVTFIVPEGTTYKVTSYNANLTRWAEFR